MKERKPYFRASCRAWYILWEGKQEWLGRDRQEANENLTRLKAGHPVERPNRVTKAPKSSEPTIRKLVDLFLNFVKANRKHSTYQWYLHFLKSFCEHVGDNLRISALKRHMVQEWISAKDWHDSAAHSAARTVVACMNWAVKWDHLAASPVKGFEKEPAKVRECYITPAEWKKVIESVDDPDFRDALLFLRLTGARPMELRFAEKRHFDPNIPAIVYPADEAKGRRGKKTERVIHLAGEALVIVQKLCLRHPEGPLFRNKNGTPWTKDVLSRRFARLSDRVKIPHLIPYAFRHTFATDCLIKGMDSLTVSELMGHRGTKMLEAVYQKVRKRQDYMKQAAERAAEEAG